MTAASLGLCYKAKYAYYWQNSDPFQYNAAPAEHSPPSFHVSITSPRDEIMLHSTKQKQLGSALYRLLQQSRQTAPAQVKRQHLQQVDRLARQFQRHHQCYAAPGTHRQNHH